MSTPANIWLSFQGIGAATGYRQNFQVICGQNPPTITDGYATWNALQRPLQRALTIFSGYDPMTMTVDVIFGQWLNGQGWQQDGTTGSQVEQDIGKLDWMAGGGFKRGPSPYVYVIAYSSAGGQSDLIPAQYHSVPWVVTGLQWGQSWRNELAQRTYQEATVTLQGYLNMGTPPRADTKTGGRWVTSQAGRDTALRIASWRSVDSPTPDHQILARRILRVSENNPCKGTKIRLERRAVTWKIRHGVAVYVPAHTIN